MQHRRLKLTLLSGLCALSASALAGGSADHHTTRLDENVDSIRASGYVHVMLRSSKKRSGRLVIAKGFHPSYKVNGNVLTITSNRDADAAHPAQVIVSLRKPLHRLLLSGDVHVEGRRVSTSALQVVMSGGSTLDLHGIVGLSQLKQSGASSARLDWVNSAHLVLNATGLSTSYLAGVTNHLDAKLAGHSTSYAQYLQARTAFVATKGNAMIYIMPLANMRAFAKGRSNIYYVAQPVHRTMETKANGNVLFMNSDDPWDNMAAIYQQKPVKKAKK